MPDRVIRMISASLAAAAEGMGVRRLRRSVAGFPQTDGPAVAAPAAEPVEEAPRTGALVMIDLDDLAGLNASDGFDVGDRLLDAAGDVLRRALPDGAELERMQGGRFLVWLPPGMRDTARAEAERLRGLAGHAIVEGHRGPVSRNVSAGTVEAPPDEPRARIILHADVALARAKLMGGGRTEAVSTFPVPAVVPSRAEIEAAIAERALEYHVQPIVRLDSGEPAGVEALIRWTRPGGDVLGPAGFLGALNRLPEAGAELLTEMAEAAARPFVTSPGNAYVAFNVSGAVLDGTSPAGGRWLAEVVERVPADRLVLEIVETAVIVRHDHARARIDELRDRGVRFALDDFGTGLSNLERLRKLPADIVKIDRGFVADISHDPRARAIVGALVALAQELRIELVAEGIETREHARQLLELGVPCGQGYHFGRPSAAGDWAARLGIAAAAPCLKPNAVPVTT